MKAYIYEWFNGITGEQNIFINKDKAIHEYDYTLEHLTDSEKGNLEYYQLFEVEATEEQIRDMQENGYSEDNSTKWTKDIKSYK